MDIEKIIEYVLKTPENVNPNVLRCMLTALVASEQPDLSFVTATADKILVGYDGASSTGAKVEGAYTPLDTSDATATAEDILSGKTAYVNGIKIEGTYVPLDTSDATATVEDIMSGKTAYVNGVKIEGTYTPTPVDSV